MNKSHTNTPISTPISRKITLVADDYAMTPAISLAILTLLEKGRLTATGAMTNRPAWQQDARPLRAFSPQADLGIHLNLTCGTSLTRGKNFAMNGDLPKLRPLLLAGIIGKLPLEDIENEIVAQLDAFEQMMGQRPDFIDGHQHIHAMPGIRGVLAQVLCQRYPKLDQRPYLRDSSDSLTAIWARGAEERKKALIIKALTAPFAPMMRRLGFRLNVGFSGFSRFDPQEDYKEVFARALIHLGGAPLIMCHPGEVDDELIALDPVTFTREKERDFLLSSAFSALCEAAGVELARFASGGGLG